VTLKGYYFITDPDYSQGGELADILTALDCGVKIIQYRDKVRPVRDKFKVAQQAQKLCSDYQATFIVNDSVEIAWAADADGVNVGQQDLPPQIAAQMLGKNRIIGVSVSNMRQVRAALPSATYLGLGPLYTTPTKSDAAKPTGLELIKETKAITSLPIAAIGGIDFGNVREVLAAGADMICAISAVYKSESLKGGINKMVAICNEVLK
jgi:thiamine-phosphate pyrophosphorylase